jgi:hypothetical protein
MDDDSGTVALATEAAIDASQAEASAQAAAESAMVATAVAAGTAAIAEQDAAATVASYEEGLNECRAQISGLQTSLAEEREWRNSALNALQERQVEMAENLSLIQSLLETEPENPENPQPEEKEADHPVAEVADDKPAAEPEPVKERRRAHRWI